MKKNENNKKNAMHKYIYFYQLTSISTNADLLLNTSFAEERGGRRKMSGLTKGSFSEKDSFIEKGGGTKMIHIYLL